MRKPLLKFGLPVLASTVGMLLTVSCGNGDVAERAVQEGLATSYPGRTPDPAIDFPEQLEIHAISIATDSAGNLWALAFPSPDRWDLTRYDAESADVTEFSIDAPYLEGFFTGVVRIDGAHVIVALGHLVVDFNAESGEHRLFDVEVDISAMGLSGRKAYLASRDVAELRELDLDTGATRVFPLGDDFYGVEDIAVAGNTVWVTTGFLTDRSPPRLTGRLNLSSGFSVVPGETIAIEAADAGEMYALGSSPLSLVSLNAGGLQPLSLALASALEEPLGDIGSWSSPDLLVFGSNQRVLFVTNLAHATIVRVDVSGEQVRSYTLPTEYVDADCSTDEAASCATTAEIGTDISSLAVAPNGNLYFFDATRNRVGVIHADR